MVSSGTEIAGGIVEDEVLEVDSEAQASMKWKFDPPANRRSGDPLTRLRELASERRRFG